MIDTRSRDDDCVGIGLEFVHEVAALDRGGGDEQVGLSGDALFGFESLGPFVAGLRVAVLDGPDRVHAHRDRGSQRSVLSGSGLDHVSGIGVDADGDFTGAQCRLGGDPIVGPDEIGGAEVGVCVEQFGKLVDRVGELILRRGADRQMVKGDALGDLQLRARAGCVAARTVSVSGVGCAAARTVKTARTVEAAGVGGEYVDAVSSRGERAHGLVDVDVHPSGVALAGLGDGRGVEGEDRNAHGDSLANDLGRVTNQKIRRGCAALRDVRATGSIRREAPRVGSSGSHGGYPRRQRPDEPGRLRE